MFSVLKAKQVFSSRKVKTPSSSLTRQQQTNSFYEQNNCSSSYTKSKTLNSTTINTMNRTGTSFYAGVKRDRTQTYTIELTKTIDNNEQGRKFKTSYKDSWRGQRKLNTANVNQNEKLNKLDISVNPFKSQIYQIDHFEDENLQQNVKQKGLLQEQHNIFLEQKEKLQLLHGSIDYLNKKLEPQEFEFEFNEKEPPINFSELDNFSLQELEYLQTEFDKNNYERLYLEMDKILIKSKFFQRFNQGIRIGILEQATMEVHNTGEVILKLGENSNNLFVILRGSCQQTLTLDILIEDEQHLTVQSYFEGQDLSEINLLQLNNNKQYSNHKIYNKLDEIKEHPKFRQFLKSDKTKLISSHISCSEKTYLLKMKNDSFQKILKQSIEKDKEFKLSVLSQIKFFQNTQAAQLLHLVAELGIQHYFQGDCIVRKGDILSKVIIIAEGEFQIVEETTLERETKNYFLEPKLKPFKFKRIIDRNTQPTIQYDQTDQSFDLTFLKSFKGIKTQKCYQFCNKKRLQNSNISYTHLHVLKELKRCDVICGRSLLIRYDNEYDKNDTNIAKLTVVVKSVHAIIFFLDEKRYQNLPESLQNQILAGLRSLQEYDDYQIGHISKEIKDWEKFKKQTYLQLLKEKRNRQYKLY